MEPETRRAPVRTKSPGRARSSSARQVSSKQVSSKQEHRQLQDACRKARPATERALELLETVVGLRGPVTLKEIAASQDIPSATAFRICQRLEREGYMIREPDGRRYAIGPRLVRLSLGVVRASGSSSCQHALLSELASKLGETCNLTMMVGSEVLYLDRVETAWPLRMMLEPGSRVPVHCTSSGKLFLAMMPEAQREELLSSLPLAASTPETIVDRDELRRELQRIAKRGYATSNEEFILGLVAIAVPIRDRNGQVLAAVACHAPTARMSLKQLVTKMDVLQDTADRMLATFTIKEEMQSSDNR